jgi:hypothetical protein
MEHTLNVIENPVSRITIFPVNRVNPRKIQNKSPMNYTGLLLSNTINAYQIAALFSSGINLLSVGLISKAS